MDLFKRILIICVNYNTYDHLFRFLDSIAASFEDVPKGQLELFVGIADNSSQKQQINISKYTSFSITIYPLDNLGYFGGASAIINSIKDITSFDFVIISNVDLVVDKVFFYSLLSERISENIAWIAPCIYSEQENRDKNPKVINRYSIQHLRVFQLMYKFPFLHKLYIKSLYKRKKSQKPRIHKFIYAGHGSFIILSKKYFSFYPKLNYPVFLFGEELYLAELIRLKNLKVLYDPSIKILDVEHSSTGNMKKKSYYKYNYQAITYIKTHFYE